VLLLLHASDADASMREVLLRLPEGDLGRFASCRDVALQVLREVYVEDEARLHLEREYMGPPRGEVQVWPAASHSAGSRNATGSSEGDRRPNRHVCPPSAVTANSNDALYAWIPTIQLRSLKKAVHRLEGCLDEVREPHAKSQPAAAQERPVCPVGRDPRWSACVSRCCAP
jgi:hypothetical protein